MQFSQPELDRFWKKVDKSEECWKWLASKKSERYGYGQLKIGGKNQGAHRVSYIIANGSIPEGMDIFHLCQNRWCVNPKHLQALDKATRLSTVDGWKATENAKKTHCPKGHPLVEGNLEKGMLKNHKVRQCLICLRAKKQHFQDSSYYKDPKYKVAKSKYDKERHLRLKEFLKNITEINKEESLIIEDDEIKGTKEDWLKELIAYNNTSNPYRTINTPQRVRVESKRQKKLIARIENYTCQLCGWSLKCKNSKGKIVHRIDIDHIVEKKIGGTEEQSNLWALCPNCHVKKTVGVIIVDLAKKRITENGKEIRLLTDNHLRWY